MSLVVSEIFYSLEGEGLHLGLPMIFVRLQGCTIGCQWCDTKYTWPEEAPESLQMPEEEVLGRIAAFPGRRVSVTGGEPLEQDIHRLVGMLKEAGYWVNLETSGQLLETRVMDRVDFISCDIKGPSSGVAPNLRVLRAIVERYPRKAQFKIVVGTPEDIEFAREWSHLDNLILQKDSTSAYEFTERVKMEFPRARYGIQLHKVLWGDRRGV
ncbi:MAG: radical SAM protein [Euryarchaeota archaeon]|nr:radical SAM protein [Euryarchaeota archaeon]